MKTNNRKRVPASDALISKLVQLEIEISKLPRLSPLEQAKLNNGRAIEHLYYSSKLEGSSLSEKKIEHAIYGRRISAA
ncbi:MAG: hypothetical protein WDN10_00840 [bacterium]